MAPGALRAVTIATLTVAALLSASPAHAGTVSRSGNAVTVTGGDETNEFDIFVTDGDLVVVDHAGPLSAGTGCVQGAANSADCGAWTTITSVTVSAGGGHDEVWVLWPFGASSYPQMNMLLGPGHDRAIGGAGTSIISGQGGNDEIGGEHPCCADPLEGGHDELLGGPGNDLLRGGEGDDLLDGGDGIDAADFGPTSGDDQPAVTVDLAAGTAVGNGSDTLVGIEDVIGSSHRDVILGDDGPNTLEEGRARTSSRGAGGGISSTEAPPATP